MNWTHFQFETLRCTLEIVIIWSCTKRKKAFRLIFIPWKTGRKCVFCFSNRKRNKVFASLMWTNTNNYSKKKTHSKMCLVANIERLYWSNRKKVSSILKINIIIFIEWAKLNYSFRCFNWIPLEFYRFTTASTSTVNETFYLSLTSTSRFST